MSTLKVNKIRDNSGSTDAIVLDPSGGAVLAGVTTVSTVKVGSGVTISSDGDVFTTGITTSSSVIVGGGVTISESGIEASGIGITCANINGAQIGGRRNIIVNGAMNVAQRGISTTSQGYATVDRFESLIGGTDENPTMAQVDVASGTTPYTSGFRKAYKITNGNQTSGAGEGDYILIDYFVEAQDIATSGWNYINPESFITLSFWVKSSVAQNFYGSVRSMDGTAQNYPYETGSLTADTWTKITKTIPGNSNLTFNNDNGQGMRIRFAVFRGTTATGSVTLNQWAAFDTNAQYPDNTSTWYTTNDATFELTGVQLEVGSQATAFEHRSFNEELTLCQRYYQKHQYGSYLGLNFLGRKGGSNTVVGVMMGFPPMRAAASGTHTGAFKLYRITDGTAHSSTSVTVGQPSTYGYNTMKITAESTGSFSTGNMAMAYTGASGGTFELDAEL